MSRRSTSQQEKHWLERNKKEQRCRWLTESMTVYAIDMQYELTDLTGVIQVALTIKRSRGARGQKRDDERQHCEVLRDADSCLNVVIPQLTYTMS